MAQWVYNVEGTSGERARDICGCPSWVEHFRRHSGSRRRRCATIGCGRDIEVGAHIKWHPFGVYEYIVGLCCSCNHHSKTEPFQIDERLQWAPTGYQIGCGVLRELQRGDVIRLTPSATDTFELFAKRRWRGGDSIEWSMYAEDGSKVYRVLHGRHVRRAGRFA